MNTINWILVSAVAVMMTTHLLSGRHLRKLLSELRQAERTIDDLRGKLRKPCAATFKGGARDGQEVAISTSSEMIEYPVIDGGSVRAKWLTTSSSEPFTAIVPTYKKEQFKVVRSLVPVDDR